jgi:class 3 adenylate cyclase/predicted ATPase
MELDTRRQEAWAKLQPTNQSVTPAVLRPLEMQAIPQPFRDEFSGPVPQIASHSIPTAERREVTVMFTDIEDYTGMSEKYDAGIIQYILNSLFDIQVKMVKKYGGVVDKFIGDGMMAIFGAPKTHGNDAYRAIRASLELRERLSDLNKELLSKGFPPLHLRVGINTGEVLAGYIGGGDHKPYTVIGTPVNLASRIEQLGKLAEGDDEVVIVVGEETVKKVRGIFRAEHMGDLKVRGIQNPVSAYLVQGTLPDPEEERVDEMKTGFYGRERELESLQETFKDVLDGTPHFSLVLGEPGYGKSRLKREFFQWLRKKGSRLAQAKNVTILRGKATDLPDNNVIAEALGKILRTRAAIEPDDNQEAIEEKIRDHVSLVFGIKNGESKVIAQLLGTLAGFKLKTEELPSDPEVLRERRNEAALQYLEYLADREIVILDLEDIHWADEGSLKLISPDPLIKRFKGKNFMILASARPEILDRVPELQKCETIKINGLPIDLCQKVVGEVAQKTNLDQDQLELIFDQSKGNPFLLQRMAAALNEGWLPESSEWEVEEPSLRKLEPAGSEKVLKETRGFLQEWIDRLSQDEKRLLQIAAVLRRDFDVAILKALGFENPDTALKKLLEKEILVGLGDGRFRLVHAMLRDAAYRMMKDTNAGLHLAAAKHYLSVGSEEHAVIASHFEEAGEEHKEMASEYYYRAAKKAFDHGFLENAATFFWKTYELSVGNPKRQLEILRRLDSALFESGTLPEQEKGLQLSLKILEENPDIGKSPDDAIDWAGVHYRMGRWLNRRRKFDEAEKELRCALAKIESQSETIQKQMNALKLKAGIFPELGLNYVWTDRYENKYEKARDMYQQGVILSKSLGDKKSIARSLVGLNYAKGKLGDYSDVVEEYGEAIEIFQEKKDLRRLFAAVSSLGAVLMELGEYQNAETRLKEAETLSEKFRKKGRGMEYLIPTLGWLYYCQGKRVEAYNLLYRDLMENPNHENVINNFVYLVLILVDDKFIDADKLKLAESMASEALRLATDAESYDEEGQAKAQMAFASIYFKKGDLNKAYESIEASYRIYKKLEGIEEFDRKILLLRSLIHYKLKEPKEALLAITEARDLVLKRARTIKKDALRDSFMNKVADNMEIERQWQLINIVASQDMSGPLQAFLELVKSDLFISDQIPAELAFVYEEDGKDEKRAIATIETSRGEIKVIKTKGEEIAGGVVSAPPIQILKQIFSIGEIEFPDNEGPYPYVVAKKPVLTPFITPEVEAGARLKFHLAAKERGRLVMPLLLWGGKIPSHFEINLKGRKKPLRVREGETERLSGALAIQLETGVQESELQKGILGDDLFGMLSIYFCPLRGDKTLFALGFESKDFTRNVPSFFTTLLEALDLHSLLREA